MATRHGEEVCAVRPGEPPAVDAPLSEAVDAQALIEEARRRQRRRRRWITIILVLVVIGAGLGLGLSFGAGAPATSAARHHRGNSSVLPSDASPVALNRPEALAVASNGDLLIANQGTDQILRRTPTGTLKVVAGTGRAGYSGDGGPALRAQLHQPAGMAVAANGTIYVADTRNNRVRAVSPSGNIRTVAGNGRLGSRGGGGPALDAEVGNPWAVALGRTGQLYIADISGVQVVSPKGVLTTVAPAGVGALSIDGAPTAFTPDAIAVGSTGDLYVADSSVKLLVELAPNGRVLASWPNLYVTPAGLAAAPDGSVLLGDYGFSLDRITHGQLTHLDGFTLNSLAGLNGTFRPSGIAVSNTGQIYAATDGVNGGTDQPAIAAISSSGEVELLRTGRSVNH